MDQIVLNPVTVIFFKFMQYHKANELLPKGG